MKSGFSHGLSRIAAKKPSVWCSGGKVRKFSSRSNSSFGLTPGARCGLSAATPKPETRRISRRPRSTSATTCSFSSGSSEQVEYTSRPPGARRSRALERSATCRRWNSARSFGPKRQRISGFRESVPVPEHGASTRMRSKLAASGSGAVASNASRWTLVTPNRFRFVLVARSRCRWRSAAITSDCGPAARASTAVLPPGAAQRSSIDRPGPASSSRATSCEASS